MMPQVYCNKCLKSEALNGMLSPTSTTSIPQLSASLTPTSDTVSLTSSESMELQKLRNQVQQLQRHIDQMESRKIHKYHNEVSDVSELHPVQHVSDVAEILPSVCQNHFDADALVHPVQQQDSAISDTASAEEAVPQTRYYTQLTSSGDDYHDTLDSCSAPHPKNAKLTSKRCTNCRIVLSNGHASTNHEVPNQHVIALFQFCLSHQARKCFLSNESRLQVLMFGGLSINSGQYGDITEEQCNDLFQSWDSTSDHRVVCVGFLISNDLNDVADVVLTDCSLECHPIFLFETHCILGLPTKRPAFYDHAKSILEYTHPCGGNKVTCDDFSRLIEGRWISEGLVFSLCV